MGFALDDESVKEQHESVEEKKIDQIDEDLLEGETEKPTSVHEELENILKKKLESNAGANEIDSELEQQIARKLYDMEEVQLAGKIALSRVSTLLVRYNRVKDAEKKAGMDYVTGIQKAKAEFDARMRSLDAEEKRLEGADPKELDKLNEAREKAKQVFDKTMKSYEKKKEKGSPEEFSEIMGNLNDDRSGGILSSLLLGGNAKGSTGYVLTTGDAMDMAGGANYIRNVSGKNGTLFSQMALLDNAMNTNGVARSNKGPYEDWIGSSALGAQYSLTDILRNATAKDVQKMNMFQHGEAGVSPEQGGVALDITALEEERKDGSLENEISSERGQKTIEQAAAERFASEYPLMNSGKENLSKEEKKSLKQEKKRLRAEQASAEKMQKQIQKAVRSSTIKPVSGFFSIFSSKPDYKKGKTPAERRALLREERRAWQKGMREAAIKRANPTQDLTLNKDDTSENSLPPMNTGAAAGKSQPQMDSKEKEASQAVKEGDPDKSVRNMISAYRLMGATPKELHQFRLALIAYMIPAGKKTLMEIMKESNEGGYKGLEDTTNMSRLYETFAKEPISDGKYMNFHVKQKNQLKFNEKKSEEVANKVTDEDRTLEKVKRSQGSLSALKRLKSEKKAKQSRKLQLASAKWLNTTKDKKIDEVEAIQEVDEEDAVVEDVKKEVNEDTFNGPLPSLLDDEEEKKEVVIESQPQAKEEHEETAEERAQRLKEEFKDLAEEEKENKEEEKKKEEEEEKKEEDKAEENSQEAKA